jgi:tetratricopeptide (TPR) repeat protein
MHKLIALTLFIAGPAIADDDPRKLAESGWKAYQQHDLATAEKLTRQAIATTVDANVKAAALYNLGRVLEDRNDRPGAIAAYKQSLELRRNSVVREQLRTLDASAADALDTLRPSALDGPFGSVDAFCKQKLADASADDRAQCASATNLAPKTPTKLAAPVQAIQLASRSEGLLLSIEVDGRWYVQELSPLDNPNCTVAAATLDGITTHGVALELSYRHSGNCALRDRSWTYREHDIVVLGVGASHKPSGTQIVVDMTEAVDGKTTMNWARKLTWNRDGSLDVAITRSTGSTEGATPDDTDDVKGHHALVFP